MKEICTFNINTLEEEVISSDDPVSFITDNGKITITFNQENGIDVTMIANHGISSKMLVLPVASNVISVNFKE